MKNPFSHRRPADAGDAALPPALTEDLASIYHAPVPPLRFDSSQPQAATPPQRRSFRLWQPAALAAGLALLAVAVFAPRPWSGGADRADAQAIFARSQQAVAPTAGTQPYHLVAVMESLGRDLPDGVPTTTTVETWFQDEAHVRTEQFDGPPGALGDLQYGMSRDGDAIWWWAKGQDGALRAVQGSAGNLEQLFFEPYPGGGTSLAQVIAAFAGECQVVERSGEEPVAGRDADVIRVLPDPEGCPAARPKDAQLADALGVMTIWVDQETFRPLKVEQGSTTGGVSFRYTIVDLNLGEPTPASGFAYEAPAGVEVTAVGSYSEAKSRVFGYGWEESSGASEPECAKTENPGDANAPDAVIECEPVPGG